MSETARRSLALSFAKIIRKARLIEGGSIAASLKKKSSVGATEQLFQLQFEYSKAVRA